MRKKELTGILGCFVLLFFAVVAWAAPVPDTGQSKCYNNTVEIPCPSPGQPFYGQDANYTINPMSYTKLDGSGNVLSSSATSWVMVKDNVTGLVWEMKTSKDGVKNYNDPHDADNTYTWYDSNPATNGGNAGTEGLGTDTEDFIKALNDVNYGGYSDWRLPTIKELDSIVNCGIPYPEPAINTTYFPNTQSFFNWSSTTNAYYTNCAWGVNFYFGLDLGDYPAFGFKSFSHSYVRAVRGGQPQSAYVNNGNGTVTDTSTGLMWELKTNKDGVQNYDDPHDADNTYTWEQALSNCETSTFADHSDWRLPTKKELRSLVDYSRYNPAINTTFFPDTVSSFYWSSTTYAYFGNVGAWGVLFGNGNDSYYNKPSSCYVRAVRGGQSGPLGDLVIAQQPMSGPPGTTFVQWGTGFTPNSTATLHFKKPDGTEYPTQPQAMDAIGHFEINYTAPWDKPPGAYTWWAIDGVTGAKSNVVSYTIQSVSGELHHFIFGRIHDQTVNGQFLLTVEAVDHNGDRVTSFSGNVYLSHNGPGVLSPLFYCKVADGYASFLASISQPNAASVIQCQYSGITGQSNVFSVTGDCAPGKVFGKVIDPSGGAADVYLSHDPYGVPVSQVRVSLDSGGQYSLPGLAGSYYIWAVNSNKKSSDTQSVKIACWQPASAPDLIIHSGKKPVIFVPGAMGTDQKWALPSIYPTLPLDFPAKQSDLQIHDPGGVAGWGTLRDDLQAYYEIYECPYDWRVSLQSGSDTYKKYLLPVIKKAIDDTGWTKVDIVAHSMGGLLVRSYIQSEDYNNDIDKFAMVGTPNHGSLSAYHLWEGGDPLLADKKTQTYSLYFYSNVANNLYQTLYGKNLFDFVQLWTGTRDVDTQIPTKMIISNKDARSFIWGWIPSTWQLMPTFDNCLSKDGNSKSIEKWRNKWLISLNNSSRISMIQNNVIGSITTKIFASNSENTLSQIQVTDSTISGLYEDGMEVKTPTTQPGDGTVLLNESANLPNVDLVPEKYGAHSGLIKSYASKIKSFLDQGRTFSSEARTSKSASAASSYTSVLGMSVTGAPSILLTDTSGARCGIDQSLQQIYKEMDGSQALGQAGKGMVSISNPKAGEFNLNLNGTVAGQTTIRISLLTETRSEEQQFMLYYSGSPLNWKFSVNVSESPMIKIVTNIGAPTGLSTTAYVSGANQYTLLTWQPITDQAVMEYRIYSRNENESELKYLASVPGSQTQYITSDIWSGPARIYFVSAVDSKGNESFLSRSADNTQQFLADFQASAISGNAPLTVQFTDKSTGSPTEWLWDFGDGATSKDKNPAHIYLAVGTFTVSLTVTDATRNQDIETKTDLINLSVQMKGDVNGDGVVDLKDAVIALQILSGISPQGTILTAADVNGDGKIGMAEAIYAMQKAAGL